MEKSIKYPVKTNQKTINWILILWNDNVNDMMHVVICLYKICKLSNKKAMSVMFEAHNKGQAFICEGSKIKLTLMHIKMYKQGIKTSVVHENGNYN